MINNYINFCREIYSEDPIPLHRPYFNKLDKEALINCIDSNFVSTAGKNIDDFEKQIADFTDSNYAISCSSGTTALHSMLFTIGADQGCEIITQSASFVATVNSILYTKASPVFVDVDRDTMGMCPDSLSNFLRKFSKVKDKILVNKKTGRRILACLPTHIFGHPCKIKEIQKICDDYGLTLLEDAAEALGSFFKDTHVGTFGVMGALSFNGNKIITTGGGGMILAREEKIAKRIKHITTTAKIPHPYNFIHDELGFNYRMPNLNASLGITQLNKLQKFLSLKRKLASQYRIFFENSNYKFIDEPEHCRSNFWLNAIECNSEREKIKFIEETNKQGIFSRPLWKLLHKLAYLEKFQTFQLENSEYFEKRVVCLPSSVPNEWMDDD